MNLNQKRDATLQEEYVSRCPAENYDCSCKDYICTFKKTICTERDKFNLTACEDFLGRIAPMRARAVNSF